MLSEIRIESLGAISTATAEFDRGLTVLTGETGTGKTMVVTGLHLLGGARADATRVRSGADRAVVEGRFTTIELGDGVAVQVDEILESSGADRDDDGSVIAARSVSRDGPSRAYLGGRSVPAKSLSTFTTELLALHGQNDQLRLMRPRRAAGGPGPFRRRRVATEALSTGARRLAEPPAAIWPTARSGHGSWRRKPTGSSSDSTKSTPSHPQPGEDDALVDDIRRLSELDALREAAQAARAALSGPRRRCRRRMRIGRQRRRAGEVGVGGHRRLGVAGAGRAARRALAVITDVSTELGDYLAELPSDASTLETKLARQGELRTLTRKYAADIDGVLQWAHESRERLAQLDVSEEALAELRAPRRRSSRPRSSAPQPNSPRRGPRPPRVSQRR